MQLKNQKSGQLGSRLALATGALLGVSAVQGADNWQTDSALLYYNESGGRVQAVEPAFNLMRNYDDGSSLNIHLVFDSLTGASPNGAARANLPQTFTTASGFKSHGSDDDGESGHSTYDISAGDLPLDPSFKDQRGVFSLGWSQPLGELYKLNVGGAFSTETDFTSLSVNGALSRDFNDKNTTVSLGTNLEFDTINPISNIPVPLGSYVAHDTAGGNDTKQVYDVMAGITQVMNRRWLVQLNLSSSQSSGYQNDPYKILTVVTDGNLIVDPDDATRYLYLFESRPDTRQKNSVFLQNKIALFSNDVLDVSFRYMSDDWGIKSNTMDLTYHWQYNEHFYLEPHYRYYQQTAADFYQPFLNSGTEVDVTGSTVTALVDYASSDPRLAEFSANTFGLKLGFPISKDEEFDVRLESYQQQDKNTAKAVPNGSNLSGYSQFPELQAAWIQIGYHYRW